MEHRRPGSAPPRPLAPRLRGPAGRGASPRRAQGTGPWPGKTQGRGAELRAPRVPGRAGESRSICRGFSRCTCCSVAQSASRDLRDPWTEARRASLPLTVSRSSGVPSIESGTPFGHLVLSRRCPSASTILQQVPAKVLTSAASAGS